VKNFGSSNSMSTERAGTRRVTPSGKAAFLFGAALLVFTLSLGLGGCSKSRTNSASLSQNSAGQNASPQNSASPTPTSASVMPKQTELARKKSVQGPVRKLARTLSYSDKTAGLSFVSPRKARLTEKDKTEQDSVVAKQLHMNFAQPGGERLVMLELPSTAKDESSSALFSISVNKQLSAEQCEQFAANSVPDRDSADQSAQESTVATGSKVTLGGVEYSEIEKDSEQNMTKYYHRFVPGASSPDSQSAENSCYEFSLEVQNAGQERGTEQKNMFARLDKVLASVKINPEKRNEIVQAGKAEEAIIPQTSESVQTAKTNVKSEVNPH
jgi:hypothetical protein